MMLGFAESEDPTLISREIIFELTQTIRSILPPFQIYYGYSDGKAPFSYLSPIPPEIWRCFP